MRCPACGFVSFDHLPACRQCGKEFPPTRVRGRMMAPERPFTRIDSQFLGSGIPGPQQPGEDEPLASVVKAAARGHAPTSPAPVLEETAGLQSRVPPSDLPYLRRAGFWLRTLAFLVDLAIVAAFSAAGGFLVGVAIQVGGWFSSTPELALEWLEGWASTFLIVLIDFCYFTLFVGWRGQTPGKMLLRLRIIRVTGEDVGYGRAFVRWIGQILSVLPLGFGFLMIAFSRKKQGLHDKLAGTYVVRPSR